MKYRQSHRYETNASTEMFPQFNKVLNRSVELYPNLKNTNIDSKNYLRHHSYSPQNGDQQTSSNGPSAVAMDIRSNREVYLSNMNVNGRVSAIVSLHVQGKETPIWEKMYTSSSTFNISGSQVFIDDYGHVVMSYFSNGTPAVARLDKADGSLMWATRYSFASLQGACVCGDYVWMLHQGGGPFVGGGGSYMIFNLFTGALVKSSWLWAGNHGSLSVNNMRYSNIQSDNENVWITGAYWFFVSLAGVADSVHIAKFNPNGDSAMSIVTGINTNFECQPVGNLGINKDIDRVLMTRQNNLGGQELFIFDRIDGTLYYYTGWPGGVIGSQPNLVTEDCGEPGFLVQVQSGNTARFWEIDKDGNGVRNIDLNVTNPTGSISQSRARTFRKTSNDESFMYFTWNPSVAPSQAGARNRGPAASSYWSAALPIKRNPDETDDLLFYTGTEDYQIKNGTSLQYSEGTSTFSRNAGQGVRGWDINGQFNNGSGIGDGSANDFASLTVVDGDRIKRETLSIITRSMMVTGL